jgi:hypothetical protein
VDDLPEVRAWRSTHAAMRIGGADEPVVVEAGPDVPLSQSCQVRTYA